MKRSRTKAGDERLLAELERMHADLKASKPRPGDEAYSLLCSIGASVGVWPKVRLMKVAEIRRRYGEWLHRRVKTTAVEEGEAHLDAIARGAT